MPKLTTSLPKYRLHRKSRQAFLELNGRRIYLGPHGTKASKLEYDRLIGEWLQNGRQLRSEDDSGSQLITIVELAVAYSKFAATYYRKNGKPTSEVRDIKLSLRPLRQLYGRMPCVKFGPKRLKVVRQKMIEGGLCRNVVNQRIGRIKRMFKWGVEEELIPANTHRRLATVAGLKKGRSAARETCPIPQVTDSVVDATLPYLPAIVADMVRLQRRSGMRPEEVCAVRPMDVDCSGDVWVYTPQHHKTQHHGKSRVVMLGPAAQSILASYLNRDPGEHCFRPSDTVAKQLADRAAARRTPVNYGNRPGTNRKRKPKRVAGDLYTTKSYYHAILRACDRAFSHPALAAIKKKEMTPEQCDELMRWQKKHRWAPNRLRHTAATVIREQFGIEASSVVLGHANVRVTEVYAERNMKLAAQVAAKLG